MKRRAAIVFVIVLLLMSACNTSGGGTSTSSPSLFEPSDTLTHVSPLVTPTETLGTLTHVSPLMIPTTMPPPTPPSSEVGTVVGFLLENGDTPQPVGQAILYLGEVITLADGTPAMAKLDKHTAPSTQTDANGRFVFTEVPIGQHVLFLDLVTKAVVLHDPSSGGDFLIEVEGGAIIDLGELIYANLPSRP